MCENVVKSVSYHLRVFSLVKHMFINSNTVRSLNVCNTVKSMSLAHHVHRVFPVTFDVISNIDMLFILKQMSFLLPKLNLLVFEILLSCNF